MGAFCTKLQEATFLICDKQTAEVALLFGTKIPPPIIPRLVVFLCALHSSLYFVISCAAEVALLFGTKIPLHIIPRLVVFLCA